MRTRTLLATAALLAVMITATGCDKVSPPGMSRDGGAAPPGQPTPAPAPPPTTAPAAAPDRVPPPSSPVMPADHPPIETAAGTAATPPTEADPTVAEFLGLRGPKPEHWRWRAPTSSMRAANYDVENAAGAKTAEMIVFFFGKGMGGSNQANIDRWAGQFTSPDGGPVEAKTSETTVDGMPVTLVELAGTYFGMGQTPPETGSLFLAAIVDAPAGNVYLRLTGSGPAVEAERAAFTTLVEGLRRAP